ncbi:hypothetical protein LP420_10885 [Massilia sp. B-10]|nr:hypothetical protein LP420_10885 [Massilia sp. B-10]UUZ55833.1 hypothetical protein LP419_10285 [Massilia sp. H-1]
MTPKQAVEELGKKIPPGTALATALDAFVAFYADTEIEGCPKHADGDMLLFEWGGPYPWDQCVSISLTRQFSFNDEDGEYDRMQQLRMSCRYDADQVSLVSGNEWLQDDDTQAFLQHILDASCVAAVKDLRMQSLDFLLHDV